jgi:hypothetical protein
MPGWSGTRRQGRFEPKPAPYLHSQDLAEASDRPMMAGKSKRVPGKSLVAGDDGLANLTLDPLDYPGGAQSRAAPHQPHRSPQVECG